MIVGISNQHFIADIDHSERMLQANVIAGRVNISELKQIATDQRLNLAFCKINLPNDVRFAVGNI